MSRRRVWSAACLLVFLGRPGAAQTLTFTSGIEIRPASVLWVTVDRFGTNAVKVEFGSPGEPFASSLLFEGQKNPATQPTTVTRPLVKGAKLQIRYSPADPKSVRGIGLSIKQAAVNAAFNTRIVAVHCDAAYCHVCYELRDPSTVHFDSLPSSGGTPVRSDFESGPRSSGPLEAKWDQKDDTRVNPVNPGSYFIRLNATRQDDIGDIAMSGVFALPAAPPSTAQCQP